MRWFGAVVVVTVSSLICLAPAAADDQQIAVGGGKLMVKAPEGWKRKQPSFQIIEHEFAIPKAAGDDADGRLTVMGSGGSVDANIDRWVGQFQDASGKKLTKENAKVEKKQVAGEELVIVDISGTYLDKPGGPFAPGAAVERKNYRMLSGIVSSKENGNYFFKLYGPAKTIEANKDAFVKMLTSLEKK